MQVRKQQLELDIEQQTGSKLGKEHVKAVYCHPAYLTSMQSTSWETLGWKKQAGIKIAGRNINNLRWHHPYGRKWRGTKKPLDESERGEWKTGIKFSIQKTRVMPSSSITPWQIDGENGYSDRLFSWAPKSLQMVTVAVQLKNAWSLEERLWQS